MSSNERETQTVRTSVLSEHRASDSRGTRGNGFGPAKVLIRGLTNATPTVHSSGPFRLSPT